MASPESTAGEILRQPACIVRPSVERIDDKLSFGDIGPVSKELCRSMLIQSTPDSSCLLYWSRRMNTFWTEELLPFTQVGNRLVELNWDGRDWKWCSSS